MTDLCPSRLLTFEFKYGNCRCVCNLTDKSRTHVNAQPESRDINKHLVATQANVEQVKVFCAFRGETWSHGQ